MKLSIELKVAIAVAAGFVALTIGAMAQGDRYSDSDSSSCLLAARPHLNDHSPIRAKERIHRKSLTVREPFGVIRLRGFPRFFHSRDNFGKRHDLRRFGAAILTEGGFVRQLPISDLG